MCNVARLVRVGAGEANRDVFSRLSLRDLSIACLWAHWAGIAWLIRLLGETDSYAHHPS